MKYLQIIVEGSTEETFVKDVLVKHFAALDIFVSVRMIKTGWDKKNNKPAKGGLMKYIQLKNDILRWIKSDRGKAATWYTTFVDLYAFPKDSESPYTQQIQQIPDHYQRVTTLESAIAQDIDHHGFIPYVQLHEFEALVLVDPNRLLDLFPGNQMEINQLVTDIAGMNPEEINESPETAPSKRIIQHLPDYEKLKAQVGPMVAEEIGLSLLRQHCSHFDEWITRLENL